MSADHSPCIICNSTSPCCCVSSLFPEARATIELLEGVAAFRDPQIVQAQAPDEEAPSARLEPSKDETYALALSPAKRAAPDRTPPVGQTKRASVLEAFANILIGFWVSVGANMLVLPHFKNPGVFREAFLIGLIFTIISFIRSYLLRRLFNLFHTQGRTSLRSPWKH